MKVPMLARMDYDTLGVMLGLTIMVIIPGVLFVLLCAGVL